MHRISDVMSRNVEYTHPNAPLIEVIQKMRQRGVGTLPVLEGRKVYGMVTARDIIARALAENKDPKQTRVSDVMTRGAHYLYDDQKVDHATRLMQDKNIRRLAILDRNQNLVGILSLKDVLRNTRPEFQFGEQFEEFRSSRPAGRTVQGVVLGVSLLAWGLYNLFQRRPELREQMRKVLPFRKEEEAA